MFKPMELPKQKEVSSQQAPVQQPQFQPPPPIPDQAINRISSTPLAPPTPSVSAIPAENPYLKKEPAKDARSEAKEASQKRMKKLWEQKDSSTEEEAKTPDLGETFKNMFGGGNAADAKKQKQEDALKTLLELE